MKKYFQTFEAFGRFQFPIDMLRYDHCFPASEQDSHKITAAMELAPHSWRVRVSRYIEVKSDMPTILRWRSFCADVDVNSIRTEKI